MQSKEHKPGRIVKFPAMHEEVHDFMLLLSWLYLFLIN